MFLEQQISILYWFLKDHVTLKTRVMMLKIHRNELHFKIYYVLWLLHAEYFLSVRIKKNDLITAHKTERFNNLSYRWQRLQNLLGVEATAWRCVLVNCILWGFSFWFHGIPFNSLLKGVEFCVEDIQVSLLPCLKKEEEQTRLKMIQNAFSANMNEVWMNVWIWTSLCFLALGCQLCHVSL